MTIHAPKGRGKAKEVESRSAASETYALPISTPTYMKAAFANLSDAASLFSGATSDDNLTENIKALKASARSLSEAADELALGVAPAAHHQPLPIRIITHNVRYATESPFEGEERWSVRFPRLCAQLAFNSSNPGSFICLQVRRASCSLYADSVAMVKSNNLQSLRKCQSWMRLFWTEPLRLFCDSRVPPSTTVYAVLLLIHDELTSDW